jgi:hypothetical protein
MLLVDEYSCTTDCRTWLMCRWSYPVCSASYPSDQLLFDSAGGVATAVEILERPCQIMAGEIGNQCHYLGRIGPPKLVYF